MIDKTYSGGFGYAAINGGNEFETDDYMIWEIHEKNETLESLNCITNQIAQYNGSKWECADPPSPVPISVY